MIPKCENCKHRLDHPEGIVCEDKLCFVEPDDTCLNWETKEVFDPTKLVAFTIVAIGIMILCAKFL